jgi:TRAP transporter TAXI family solute receptor
MGMAFLPILLCAPCLAISSCAPNAKKFLTGSEQGNYYKLGSAIAKVAQSDGLELCVETTPHSLDNVSELETGTADFAIAQSDVFHDAWYGHRPFRNRALHVHIVQPLYLEAVHILLRPHMSIARLEDLKGKKVGIFLAQGGTAYTAKHILASVGLQWEGSEKNFNAVPALDPNFCHSVIELAEGNLDALFRVTVVPSGDIRDAVALEPNKKPGSECAKASEVKLFPLEHELAERLVRDGSYVETLILKDKYRQPSSTLTVGVEALLLSGRDSRDEDVAHLARLLRFKRSEIEKELTRSINQERSNQDNRGDNELSLAMLNVPIPALMPFVHRSAKEYAYDWWRDSWRHELPELLAVGAVLAGLVFRKRKKLGYAMERQPNLIFAVASTLLIWFIATCALYSVGGVDEHFNSFPRSLFSTFLCLASFPGYDVLNQDASAYAQIARWLSVVLLGGFASPLLKEGVDTVLGRISKWLQRETQGTGRRKRKEPTQIVGPGGGASTAGAEEMPEVALAPGAD